MSGRRFVINITEDDKAWANHFFNSRGLDPANCVLFEYNSYSHPVAWQAATWTKLFSLTNIKFIGVAGPNESAIPGMIDARGISWRQTVALLNRVPKMVGVGSGITMLAAGAEQQPKIY